MQAVGTPEYLASLATARPTPIGSQYKIGGGIGAVISAAASLGPASLASLGDVGVTPGASAVTGSSLVGSLPAGGSYVQDGGVGRSEEASLGLPEEALAVLEAAQVRKGLMNGVATTSIQIHHPSPMPRG